VSDSEAYRLLVIDDDEVDREAVRRALGRAGLECEVVERDDAASALDALRPGGWDCVLLDYQLPGTSGLDVLRAIREEAIGTPVIMLTGMSDRETAVELMKAGAVDYVAKGSYTPERLAQAIRHAVRVARAERATRLAEAALRSSEARFRALHETSPDGFMIFRSVRDESGSIIDFRWEYANPASERMVGRSASELIGKRLLEVLPGNRDEGLFDLYRRVVEERTPGQIELRYARDGLDAIYRITAASLEDGFAVGFSDVTPQRSAEADREAALASRSRFYAAMSHELRTPINAVLGYNDLILAGVYGELGEGQQTAVERAQRAARHLLDLVNDVLDLSKLEAGKLEVEPERVDVRELVRDLFTTVRPLAEERGTELRLAETGGPTTIESDPRRVRQILLNLVSNALKFGRGRPVDVRCGADPFGVRVEVEDRGSGIPEEHRDRIFEEFVQLPGSGTEGTGLGLPISRRLAGLLGGRLEVESREGEGSVFFLVLPFVTPAEPRLPG
jgi:PAS domain S-box-containing protein